MLTRSYFRVYRTPYCVRPTQNDGNQGANVTELAIEAVDLVHSYRDHRVLDGINLAVQRGTVVALLGPNGAGKTTIIRILATLITADAGRATCRRLRGRIRGATTFGSGSA